MGYTVAIAGATGAVGVEMIKVLERRNFPVKELRLLASSRSAGKKMTYKGQEITIQELDENSFDGVDLAFVDLQIDTLEYDEILLGDLVFRHQRLGNRDARAHHRRLTAAAGPEDEHEG